MFLKSLQYPHYSLTTKAVGQILLLRQKITNVVNVSLVISKIIVIILDH